MEIEPSKLSSFIDKHYIDEAEEDICTLLGAEFKFGVEPVLTRTFGNTPEYDFMFDLGGTDVIRAELKVSASSWLPVEYSDNGKATGLTASTADIWVFLTVGGTNFDNRGSVLANGSRVEGKFNVIKRDTLYCLMRDNQEDSDFIKWKDYDGTRVAYINPRAFPHNEKYWLGTCNVTLRTKSEMVYNSSEIKGFDTDTFIRNRSFRLSRVLKQTGTYDDKKDQLIAIHDSERLEDIVVNCGTRNELV